MYIKEYTPEDLDYCKEFYPHWDQLMCSGEFDDQMLTGDTLIYLDHLYQSSRSLVEQELFLGTFRKIEETEFYSYHQLPLEMRNQLRAIYNQLRLHGLDRIEVEPNGQAKCFVKDTLIIACHVDQLVKSVETIDQLHEFKPLLLQTVVSGTCAKDQLKHFKKRRITKSA